LYFVHRDKKVVGDGTYVFVRRFNGISPDKEMLVIKN
jgi:hypothetical protein